jgi:hypothetical protein
MALGMSGTCAALLGLVRALPDTWPGHIVAIAAAGAVAVVAGSLLEWLIHRYIYHGRVIPLLGRISRIHQRGHHHVIFPTWRYVTNGPPRRHVVLDPDGSHLHPAGWRNSLTKLSHFAFYMTVGAVWVWLPAWLLTQHAVFVAALVAANVVIADLIVRVHDAIHYPAMHPWLQRQRWFRFLDRHHYIHHVDMQANVNFLLPLADLLFGTLRSSLTAAEETQHGSFEEAKAHPRGMSEPAWEVARPRALREAEAAPLHEETRKS